MLKIRKTVAALVITYILCLTLFPAAGLAGEKNGEIYILFTSDVHCGIDKGFGYAGLKQVRDSLEARGFLSAWCAGRRQTWETCVPTRFWISLVRTLQL